MTTTNNNADTIERLLAAENAQRTSIEKALIEKYGSRIVPESCVRAIYSQVDGAPEKWGRKFICQINTIGADGKPDGNRRWVATSDVFHTFHTEEVSKMMKTIKIQARKSELRKLMEAIKLNPTLKEKISQKEAPTLS